MKKILKYASVIFVALLLLVSCGKYKAEAGCYEMTKISMDGVDITNNYEYYTIELKSNGDCTVKSKGIDNSSSYEANCTFEINENIIKVITEKDGTTIIEEYTYNENEIIMDTKLNGVHIKATFTKK